MRPEHLEAWRGLMGFNRTQAADELGVSVGAYKAYETGSYPNGNDAPIPLTVALACSAIAFGLPPYRGFD